MNRELAKTVLAAFRTDDAAALRRRFAQFDEHAWRRTGRWLHSSGMALHFLDRAAKLRITDAIPASIMHELSLNLAENRARTADLFEEFQRLNTGMLRAGISYVNVKGFTLAPAAFADPALRYQQDLDFLVARRDLGRCAQVLEACGYQRRVWASETWEFSSGVQEKSSLRELYRMRPVKNVELHPLSESEERETGSDRISRMKLQVWNGFEFPALNDADQFLSQATHIFKHLQSEWTRTAWLLEYANAVRARKCDAAVWREAMEVIDAAPEIRTGVAIAGLLTECAFDVSFPREFRDLTIGKLRPEVRLWVEHYQEDLALNQHPGSKLYLLLEDILEGGNAQRKTVRRKRLLPLHLPPKVMHAAPGSLRKRWKAAAAQLWFTVGRLWFHVSEGLRYKLEAARWRRFMSGAGL